MAIRAVLFDRGNTLVGYYTSREFPLVESPHDHLTTPNLAGIIARLPEAS